MANRKAKARSQSRAAQRRPTRSWRIGVADTTFARFDMGASVLDQWAKVGARVEPVRYTVPGFKDLPVACKILLERRKCDAVIALGMAGGAPIDEVCAHEASQGLQQVQLATNKHVIECFVHTPEARDEADLAALMDARAREHAENVYYLLENPSRLEAAAGQGLRQGRADEGAVKAGGRARKAPVKIAIVWSKFNGPITRPMLAEAQAEAKRRGAVVVKEVAVEGAFDIPTAAREVLKWTDADAVVTLGAVVQGETKHDELVAHRAADALLRLAAEFGRPVALGITGPGMTWEQAKARIPNARFTVRAALAQVEALRRARAR